MGVIKQGILGGFSGSVGAITGSSWKGVAVIKAKPLSVANPKTALQVTNREKFAQAVKFSKAILVGTIKPLLDRGAVKQSGYNKFVSLNQAQFSTVKLANPGLLTIAQGVVTGISELAGSVQYAGHTVTATFTDNTGVGDALATDKLHGVIYNETLNEAVSMITTRTRADLTAVTPVPASWVSPHVIHVWCAYLRADGSKTSNTSYDAV